MLSVSIYQSRDSSLALHFYLKNVHSSVGNLCFVRRFLRYFLISIISFFLYNSFTKKYSSIFSVLWTSTFTIRWRKKAWSSEWTFHQAQLYFLLSNMQRDRQNYRIDEASEKWQRRQLLCSFECCSTFKDTFKRFISLR